MREMESVIFYLNRVSKQAQPVTGASAAAVEWWYSRNLLIVNFKDLEQPLGASLSGVLDWLS